MSGMESFGIILKGQFNIRYEEALKANRSDNFTNLSCDSVLIQTVECQGVLLFFCIFITHVDFIVYC